MIRVIRMIREMRGMRVMKATRAIQSDKSDKCNNRDKSDKDDKRDMNLPGACRAAAMPLALDLAPRGSARPGRRQGHFRYAEGCQGPLPPPHCKLMRDLLEASIRRPLWRFGVARATAMM